MAFYHKVMMISTYKELKNHNAAVRYKVITYLYKKLEGKCVQRDDNIGQLLTMHEVNAFMNKIDHEQCQSNKRQHVMKA